MVTSLKGFGTVGSDDTEVKITSEESGGDVIENVKSYGRTSDEEVMTTFKKT